MKSLYSKYQSNKHLFVIPLLILVLALYFLPTFIQFEYSVIFNGETIIQPTSYNGWFYVWTTLKHTISYNDMVGASNAQIYLFCILPLISATISCIFVLLCYKHPGFSLGSLPIVIQNIVYIGLFKHILIISAKENVYISFSIILNLSVLIYAVFLFCIYLFANKRHKPTKSERIAELEKQVADLQSKLPSETD